MTGDLTPSIVIAQPGDARFSGDDSNARHLNTFRRAVHEVVRVIPRRLLAPVNDRDRRVRLGHSVQADLASPETGSICNPRPLLSISGAAPRSHAATQPRNPLHLRRATPFLSLMAHPLKAQQ